MDRWDKTHCDKCHKKVNKGKGIYALGGFYHKNTCYKQMQNKFVSDYQWDEFKTNATDEMICPHCGYENKDSFEYREDEGERTCGRCDRIFNFTREIIISYSTGK